MKENSLFFKYILFILGIISLMPGMVYSQTFKHNEGIANKKGDYNWNGTQKCHELTYYYYVTIALMMEKDFMLFALKIIYLRVWWV